MLDIPDRELDPPEGQPTPEGFQLLQELPVDTADQLFADELVDIAGTLLKHIGRGEINSSYWALVEAATKAGESEYAITTWREGR